MLVLLNGFFVAAEFSLVKIRNTKLRTTKIGNPKQVKSALLINQNQDIYLSACQLGITLTSLGLGWIGEPAFSQLIDPVFKIFAITAIKLQETIAIVFGFVVITLLHIVLGEIVPKSIAIRKAEKTALLTAIPLYYFYKLSYPFIYLLNQASFFIIWLLGYRVNDMESNKFSKEEVRLIIGSSISDYKVQNNIIENALDIIELDVADLMSSIDELYVINESEYIVDTIKLANKLKFSRYPIYQGNKNNIIGMIHIKDLLSLDNSQRLEYKNNMFLRAIEFVNDDVGIIELLQIFRERSSHFAIVKNAINEIIGFITLDIIVSALIGNIKDEYNTVKEPWIRLDNNNLLFKGNTSLYYLEKALDIDLKINNINTISGLITHKLENIPKENEYINFQQFSIVIKRMRGPYILLVKVIPQQSAGKKKNT